MDYAESTQSNFEFRNAVAMETVPPRSRAASLHCRGICAFKGGIMSTEQLALTEKQGESMKLEEYQGRLEAIQEDAKLKQRRLEQEFARSNSHVETGDMVTDYIGSVRVTEIGYYMTDGVPGCCYHGYCYTKAGKPFKSGETRNVYQGNLVKS